MVVSFGLLLQSMKVSGKPFLKGAKLFCDQLHGMCDQLHSLTSTLHLWLMWVGFPPLTSVLVLGVCPPRRRSPRELIVLDALIRWSGGRGAGPPSSPSLTFLSKARDGSRVILQKCSSSLSSFLFFSGLPSE